MQVGKVLEDQAGTSATPVGLKGPVGRALRSRRTGREGGANATGEAALEHGNFLLPRYVGF